MQTTKKIARTPSDIFTDGYQKFSLNGNLVFVLRENLAKHNCEWILGGIDPPDDSFVDDYKRMVDYLHDSLDCRLLVRAIVADNIDYLQSVVCANGKSLRMQRKPYMRILRPNKPQDSVGIHRDTHYGATPNEWVLWIPLTDAVHGGELGIIPGSHLKSDFDYPWVQDVSADTPRGSVKHALGYMYAPKKMGREVESQCEPIPCRVGEAILFNAACVHGAKVNTAPWARFSVDVRLVEKGAAVTPHGIHGENYEDVL